MLRLLRVLAMGALVGGTTIMALTNGPATAVAAPPQGTTAVQLPYPSSPSADTTSPEGIGSAVTCPAVTSCVAVGTYQDTTTGRYYGMIETGYGSNWSAVVAPEPPNAGTDGDHEEGVSFGGFEYTGSPVSCASTTSCVAVGEYQDTSGNEFGLIEMWNGSTWTPVEAPVPSNAGNDGDGDQDVTLASVSCPSSSWCVATGSYEDSSGHNVALIETLSGGVWTGVAAPQPGTIGGESTQDSYLESVVCLSTTSCEGVGNFQDGSSFGYGLIDTLSGTSWSATSAPEPSNAGTDGDSHQQALLTSVSCPSSTSCAAVGEYDDTSGQVFPLMDTLSGGGWSAAPGTLPSNAGDDTDGHQYGALHSVSCPAPTNCVAVGEFLDTSGNDFGLIESWSGSAWTPSAAPEPANAATISGLHSYPILANVSCPAANSCLAVGYYSATGGTFPGLIEKWNGATWSGTAAPVPSTAYPADSSGGQDGFLLGVACNSPVSCVIVGQFSGSSGENEGLAITETGVQGYWLGASDGGVFNYGNAAFEGSTGSLHLNAPVVGVASTPDGQGYWLVASDGGIFTEGDAHFYGSRGGEPLNKPIVGIAATPDGGGYWLVASDGGIFNYGDAGFFGSSGSLVLNKPVVGMAATTTGLGYWLVASDGGIFNYGDAPFYGSAGSLVLVKPVVGIATSPSGKGYWLAASDGGIFNYGDAPFYGSRGGHALNKPVVGVAGG